MLNFGEGLYIYILFIIHLGYWYPILGFIIFGWEKSLHEPICLVFAFTILNSWTSFFKRNKQGNPYLPAFGDIFNGKGGKACFNTPYIGVFWVEKFTFQNGWVFEKRFASQKCVWIVFFFARATAWRPFLSRRAFHDHQVEGCGFVGLTFPGLKVSHIHEINTFTWQCLQVFSLVGNTEISVYIDIYIIALFLLHMYHVLNE